jgi:antitoxin HicB
MEYRMYQYPITIHEEAGSYWSTCPDIPEAHSAGDTREALQKSAAEGIKLALTIYVDQGRRIPAGSPATAGQPTIWLPAQVVAKIVLWNEMCEKGMRVADLARTLQLSHTVAARLVDFEHNSKIEQIETALSRLGRRILVQPLDPEAVAIQFYPSFNPKGHRTILVKLPSVSFSELPDQLREAYKDVVPQEDIINLNNLKCRWWLSEVDSENLKTKGWSAFSFS